MGKAAHYKVLRLAMSTEHCMVCLEKNSNGRRSPVLALVTLRHGHKWVCAGDTCEKGSREKGTQLGIRQPVPSSSNFQRGSLLYVGHIFIL